MLVDGCCQLVLFFYYFLDKKFTIYDGYIWRYNRETYYEYINERRSDYLKIIGSEGQNVDNSENQDSSFISANESLKLPV
jgi:hypothetical protein